MRQAASRARNGLPFDDGWDHSRGRPAAAACKPGSASTRRARSSRVNQLAGYRVRPVDQPVSRVRARLRLLLCAAEPRLSRPVPRSRFRDPALPTSREAAELLTAELRKKGYKCRADRARQQYRPVPAGRAAPRVRAQFSKCCAISSSGPRRHKGDADPARPGHSRPSGARTSCHCSGLRHDARQRCWRATWNRVPQRRSAVSKRSRRWPGPASRPGFWRRRYSGAERQRYGGDPRTRRTRPEPRSAGYTLLRLPLELKALFKEWIEEHAPAKAARVLSLVAQCHGGRL